MRQRWLWAILLFLMVSAASVMAVPYDDYRQTLGDRRWHTKLNAFIEAVSMDVTNLFSTVENWALTEDYMVMVTATPTYADADTFTLPGDYTAKFTAGKVVITDMAAGLATNTVASASFGGGVTTVNLTTANLTDPVARVWVMATRDGLFPYGLGWYVGRDYGAAGQTALTAVITAVSTQERELVLSPGAWTVSTDTTIPANVTLRMVRGAYFDIATGITLTINGPINAGPWQIFDGAGTADSIGTSTAYDVWWDTPITDPEGAVKAEIGSLFILTSGTEPIVFVKESGSGNTGWAGLISESATASETRAGLVERATDVEAAAGTDTTRYISAKQMHAQVPSSCIMMWPTETPPTGWLECNGAAVSRVTYSALFAVISTMYGAGDGSTTFNLPDMRGQFVRGWDHSAGNDPDAATRTDRGDSTDGDHVGTLQTDELASHTHVMGGAITLDGGAFTVLNPNTGSTYTTQATGGNETRPINIAMMYIIKY